MRGYHICIHVITNLISSQYVFAFVERSCAVSGVSRSRVYGSSRRVQEVSSGAGGFQRFPVVSGVSGKFLVKPGGLVREKFGHKIICPGTCNHTTGIMLR